MTPFTFANPLPWWGVAMVVAGSAAVAWLAYARFAATPARRNALIALRFASLIVIVAFLMRPVRAGDGATHEAVVPVLVDISRSMSIADAGDGTRRIDRARDLVRELLPALSAHFEVDLLSFGDRLAPASDATLVAAAGHSDLAGAIAAARERYRGRPVAGIVVVSDGGDTGAGATPGDTPVYAIGVGAPVSATDREVLSVTAAEAIFDDSRLDLAVSAVAHGSGVDPVPLQLLENGRPIEALRVVPSAPGAPVRAVFQVAPPSGQPTVYTVEVPPSAGDLVPENNRRQVLVQPPARVRHVLFVEGAPGFEHSFLKRAWAADRGLDVDAITRKGKNEQGADTFYIQASQARSDMLTRGFPQRAEDLFQYDAVVLANVDGTQLTREQLELTRAFVGKRGGGLLVLGARSFTKTGLTDSALEEALPLQFSGRDDAVLPASSRGTNRVTLTSAGELHPIMQLAGTLDETRKRWDAVPALASTAPLGAARPAATVLAVSGGTAGGSRALVAVQRYGEGRSMIFTGEAAWRWRMMLPSKDRSYDTFWRQAVRWLALPALNPVTIHAPVGASAGDTIVLRAEVRDRAFEPVPGATVDLHVVSPDGRTTRKVRAEPETGDNDKGYYVARVQVNDPGVYRIATDVRRGPDAMPEATTNVLVGGADVEMTDPRLNLPVLERVALGSGGQVVAALDLTTLVNALRRRVPAARLAVVEDVWHTAWSFAALVALLGAEWILRRRWGLR